MELQEILLQINNQCARVQNSIGKHYENPHNKNLLAEFKQLSALLKQFWKILSKT
ncbi:MAG: hypothetical protein FWE32_01600 [Oscillospiraceae bacterium]|nr:hypothetical protein [Oscillospiraceae bacterium]